MKPKRVTWLFLCLFVLLLAGCVTDTSTTVSVQDDNVLSLHSAFSGSAASDADPAPASQALSSSVEFDTAVGSTAAFSGVPNQEAWDRYVSCSPAVHSSVEVVDPNGFAYYYSDSSLLTAYYDFTSTLSATVKEKQELMEIADRYLEEQGVDVRPYLQTSDRYDANGLLCEWHRFISDYPTNEYVTISVRPDGAIAYFARRNIGSFAPFSNVIITEEELSHRLNDIVKELFGDVAYQLTNQDQRILYIMEDGTLAMFVEIYWQPWPEGITPEQKQAWEPETGKKEYQRLYIPLA